MKKSIWYEENGKRAEWELELKDILFLEEYFGKFDIKYYRDYRKLKPLSDIELSKVLTKICAGPNGKRHLCYLLDKHNSEPIANLELIGFRWTIDFLQEEYSNKCIGGLYEDIFPSLPFIYQSDDKKEEKRVLFFTYKVVKEVLLNKDKTIYYKGKDITTNSNYSCDGYTVEDLYEITADGIKKIELKNAVTFYSLSDETLIKLGLYENRVRIDDGLLTSSDIECNLINYYNFVEENFEDNDKWHSNLKNIMEMKKVCFENKHPVLCLVNEVYTYLSDEGCYTDFIDYCNKYHIGMWDEKWIDLINSLSYYYTTKEYVMDYLSFD